MKIQKVKPNAITPTYGSEQASGFDLYSTIEITLDPKSRVLIPTGLIFDIPKGFEIQIRSRSGLALNHGVVVLNSPGTIDCVTEGTLISTPDGQRKVEDLFNENSIVEVLSYNEDSKIVETDVLSDMWIVEDLDLLEITTEEGDVIKLPYNKQVMTKSGWKMVFSLTEEDEILKL